MKSRRFSLACSPAFLLAQGSLIVGGLVARDAFATSYYVGPPGTGSDRNPGTQAQPFATIGQGARTAVPGDTVFIHGGTYSESVIPGHAGTSAAWITFRAVPGELPVLDGNGAGGTGFSAGGTGFIRVVGLASRRWASSGFDNGWTNPVGDVQFIDCIADNNGINGIAFYKATGVLIQNSLVVHNGNMLPSWSSGVNLFTAGGTFQDNQVIGNVSFENVDISTTHSTPAGHPTDGSGFILDQNSTGALFENNIGFRNGGSCIRLTNSSGAHLIDNTCYHDALDPDDGTPANPAEIYFSDATSTSNVIAANSALFGGTNNIGINQTSGSGSTFVKNVTMNGGGAATVFVNPAAANFAPAPGASTLIDQGNAADAPSTDIGFDSRCITQASAAVVGQAISWWGYWVDYAYVASVGGVAGCFHPAVRPQGAGPDVGAYELGGQLADAGAGASSGSSGGVSSGGVSDAGGASRDAGAAGGGSSGAPGGGGAGGGSSSGASGAGGGSSSGGPGSSSGGPGSSSGGPGSSSSAAPGSGGPRTDAGSADGAQGAGDGGDAGGGCALSRPARGSSPWALVSLGAGLAALATRRRKRAR
jgi:hypothetical protein